MDTAVGAACVWSVDNVASPPNGVCSRHGGNEASPRSGACSRRGGDVMTPPSAGSTAGAKATRRPPRRVCTWRGCNEARPPRGGLPPVRRQCGRPASGSGGWRGSGSGVTRPVKLLGKRVSCSRGQSHWHL